MANPFYAPGAARAAKVGDLFSVIARRYDLLNDVQSFGLHRHWKRRLVSLANPQPGERALDLCCGTGDLAFALARRSAEVVGLDFSEMMLAVAESRRPPPRRKEGRNAGDPTTTLQSAICNPRFIFGDAQQIPFPDSSFDIVMVGYGLRNLADWRRGLHEMRRVAKPGGRLLVLEFGKPRNRFWRGLYFTHLKLFVPVLGRIFCGNAEAYAYILESLKHYPTQTGVAAELQAMGLVEIRTINFLGGIMSINYGTKQKVRSDSMNL